MKKQLKRWAFPLSIFLLTLFGVFVLPFLIPPPYLAGVSAANVAGFNNKVSSLAAAVLGVIVFLVVLRSPGEDSQAPRSDYAKLPFRFVAITIACVASIDSVCSAIVAASKARFFDASYFIEQISAYVNYGRKLYDQIEFPYGPIIFYGPVAIHWMLSPWHVSLKAAYLATLVVEHVVGLLLVAFVLNSLPILQRWKIILFLACAPNAIPFSYGLNYTFSRALGSAALLVVATRTRSVWKAFVWLFVGQVISLGISPEMGFGFAAAGIAYAAYMLFTIGRAWLACVVSPVLAAGFFFAVAGAGYLRMLKLFAHGIYNFVVGPLPHILIFLLALVWFVPVFIARCIHKSEASTPMLIALYVFSIALLPVAFGRADPGHVLFNGIVIYMLSFAAIGSYSLRSQAVWAVCVGGIFLWTSYMDQRPHTYLLRWAAIHDIARMGSDAQARAALKLVSRVSPTLSRRLVMDRQQEDVSMVMARLHSIVGNDRVATPEVVDLTLEQALQASGQYTPTFYYFQTAVLDATAEDREIEEFNTSRWALIPKGMNPAYTETLASAARSVGFDLHYRERRAPYVVGLKFTRNLEENWQPYGDAGDYEVYRHR